MNETGRVIRGDKRGVINANASRILADLHISDENWLMLTTNFECVFTSTVGTAEHLSEFSEHVGLQMSHGIANAQPCSNSA